MHFITKEKLLSLFDSKPPKTFNEIYKNVFRLNNNNNNNNNNFINLLLL